MTVEELRQVRATVAAWEMFKRQMVVNLETANILIIAGHVELASALIDRMIAGIGLEDDSE